MAESKADHGLILANAAILSFCSLGYQQTLALALSDATSDYVLSQAAALGLFLLGLGLGGFASERFTASWRTLLITEWLLSILGMASAAYLFSGEIALKFFGTGQPLWSMYLTAAPLLVGIGLLNGLELPLLIRLSSGGLKPGALLAANYGGAFAATVLIPIYIFPVFDVSGSAHVLGLINFIAASLILPQVAPGLNRMVHLALGLLLLATMNLQPALNRLFLQTIYFSPHFTNVASLLNPSGMWSLLGSPLRIRSKYQWIDVVPPEFSENIQGKQDFQIYLDRKIQVSSGSYRRYHESMVHGAVNALGRDPKRVLVLGGGDGLLASELLKYSSVQFIDLVELDPEMIELGRRQKDLVRLNVNSLNEARVNIHIGDAFQFLKTARKSKPYDLILADFPFPVNYDLSLLYTKEFYAKVRRALNQHGVFILDFPQPGGSDDQLPVLIHTLRAAGFMQPLAFGMEDFFVAVSNRTKPLKFHHESLAINVSNQTLLNLVSRQEDVDRADAVKARINSVLFPVKFTRGDPGGSMDAARNISFKDNGDLLHIYLTRFRASWERTVALGSRNLPPKLQNYWMDNFYEPRDFAEEIAPGLKWPRFQWGLETRGSDVMPVFQWFDVQKPARLRTEWQKAYLLHDNSEWIGVSWTADKSVVEFFVPHESGLKIRRYEKGAFSREYPVEISSDGLKTALWKQDLVGSFASALNNPRAAAIQFTIQREYLINARSLAKGEDFERVYYP